MRKLRTLFYFLMVGVVSMTACKDDDADSGPKVAENTLSINNKTIPLNAAVALNGSDFGMPGSYIMSIMNNNGENFAAFMIYPPSGQTGFTGNYTVGDGTKAGTFLSAVGLGCQEGPDGETNCANTYETAAGSTGTLKISKAGNIYTVDFDVNFPGSVRGLGNYKGSVFEMQ